MVENKPHFQMATLIGYNLNEEKTVVYTLSENINIMKRDIDSLVSYAKYVIVWTYVATSDVCVLCDGTGS